MSSSEQAPEPTMDEILASIRKIIADDDESSAPAPQAPEMPTHAAASPEPAQGIPDALHAGASAAEAEDDIFELTDPVSQARADSFDAPQPPYQTDQHQPPVVDPYSAAPAPEAPAAPPVAGGMTPQAEPSFAAEAPQPEPSFAADAPHPVHGAGVSDVLSGAPMEETALPETAAGFETAESQFSGAESQFSGSAGWQTGREEPPVPETGEIADLDQFAPGQTIAGAGDGVDAAYAESDVVAAASGAHEPSTLGEDLAMPGAGEDPVFRAAEAVESASVAEAPDVAAASPSPEASPSEPVDVQEEQAASDTAEAPKSLEDSIKEMLRPMLREWLDDNMPRIVESAVRDELHSRHD